MLMPKIIIQLQISNSNQLVGLTYLWVTIFFSFTPNMQAIFCEHLSMFF